MEPTVGFRVWGVGLKEWKSRFRAAGLGLRVCGLVYKPLPTMKLPTH